MSSEVVETTEASGPAEAIIALGASAPRGAETTEKLVAGVGAAVVELKAVVALVELTDGAVELRAV